MFLLCRSIKKQIEYLIPHLFKLIVWNRNFYHIIMNFKLCSANYKSCHNNVITEPFGWKFQRFHGWFVLSTTASSNTDTLRFLWETIVVANSEYQPQICNLRRPHLIFGYIFDVPRRNTDLLRLHVVYEIICSTVCDRGKLDLKSFATMRHTKIRDRTALCGIICNRTFCYKMGKLF